MVHYERAYLVLSPISSAPIFSALPRINRSVDTKIMDPAPFFNGAVLSAHRNVVVAPFTELRMKSGIRLHSFEAKQTTMSEKRSTSGPCVKYFSSSSCCPSKPASPAYKIQSLKEAIAYLLTAQTLPTSGPTASSRQHYNSHSIISRGNLPRVLLHRLRSTG